MTRAIRPAPSNPCRAWTGSTRVIPIHSTRIASPAASQNRAKSQPPSHVTSKAMRPRIAAETILAFSSDEAFRRGRCWWSGELPTPAMLHGLGAQAAEAAVAPVKLVDRSLERLVGEVGPVVRHEHELGIGRLPG